MEGECKIMLDSHTHAEEKKCQRWSWAGILLVFTLCLAAAATAALVYSSHTQSPEADTVDAGLHLKLRELSNVRAAIHLQGEYDENCQTSVKWSSQVDQSHSQGGLRLENNEIVIPRKGLYFVYSQVTFHVSCSEVENGKPMVTLSHTVLRRSHSYGYDDHLHYVPILHSARTACQRTADAQADGKWFSAIYVGAVFSLDKGDRLKTEMKESMLEDLVDESGNNYFGVFAL